MSTEQNNPNDPLAFVRNLWGGMGFNLPGMVAPTFDIEELDKRIKDMKAVEGWLRMNLSMLQMTIQSLEMQRTTVSTVQTMSKMASEAVKSGEQPPATPDPANPGAFSEAAMWPWQMMQQMREQMEQQASDNAATEAAAEKTSSRRKK
jgi:phage protein D